MTSAERVSIGFSGGQVVEVRIDDNEAEGPPQGAREAGRLARSRRRGGHGLDRPQPGRLHPQRDHTTANRLQRVKLRRLLLGAAAATAGAALWWRKNPSACPYGQRFWVEAPHPADHPPAAAGDPRSRAGRADPRGRPGDRLLHARSGRVGQARRTARHPRPPAGDARPHDAPRRREGTGEHHADRGRRHGDALRGRDFRRGLPGHHLGEIPDQEAALRELARVLQPRRAPGGRRAAPRRPALRPARPDEAARERSGARLRAPGRRRARAISRASRRARSSRAPKARPRGAPRRRAPSPPRRTADASARGPPRPARWPCERPAQGCSSHRPPRRPARTRS